MFLFRCCVQQDPDGKSDDSQEVLEVTATSVSRRIERAKEVRRCTTPPTAGLQIGLTDCSLRTMRDCDIQGSVTTPGGSKRFGSFAGRFALASHNPNNGRESLDNYDLLSPEQLRMASRRMRTELDNLYKAGPNLLLPQKFMQGLHHPGHASVLPSACCMMYNRTSLSMSVRAGFQSVLAKVKTTWLLLLRAQAVLAFLQSVLYPGCSSGCGRHESAGFGAGH